MALAAAWRAAWSQPRRLIAVFNGATAEGMRDMVERASGLDAGGVASYQGDVRSLYRRSTVLIECRCIGHGKGHAADPDRRRSGRRARVDGTGRRQPGATDHQRDRLRADLARHRQQMHRAAARSGAVAAPRRGDGEPRQSRHARVPAAAGDGAGRASAGLVRIETTGLGDIDAALAHAAAQKVQALFVADDSYVAADPAVRRRVLAFASAFRMPVVSSHQPYVRDGALLTMGPSIPVLAARAAGYVDRILKGARPSDLPVELPSVLTTLVNRRVAEALTLNLPQSLIARADEVIE
jgi:hypothetical protein